MARDFFARGVIVEAGGFIFPDARKSALLRMKTETLMVRSAA